MAYLFQNADGTEPISDSDGELKANAHLYGVISGCGATADTGDMTVDGTAGSILHNGSVVAVAGGTDSWTLVADPSSPRFSWLAYSNAGAAQVVSGDASADPIVPELGDRVADQLVYIPANETLASNCTFIDKRVRTHVAVTEPGIVLLASSDTPVATTSTSEVDMVVISGLSIPVTSGFKLEFGFSKDALAANGTVFGIKVNATQIRSVVTATSATQQAEDGFAKLEVGPRTAAAPNGWITFSTASFVTSSGGAGAARDNAVSPTAAMPVAEITSVTITGRNTTNNNNHTVEWYRLWEMAI